MAMLSKRLKGEVKNDSRQGQKDVEGQVREVWVGFALGRLQDGQHRTLVRSTY